MKNKDIKSIYTLHRYFIWCNRMRSHFDNLLLKNSIERSERFSVESMLYMSYWYAGLYVVVEGWRESNLKDEKIDNLLTSKNIDLLRRYRNGVFHFQTEYYDDRLITFIKDGENCVEWIRELNNEFGRYFLDFFKPSNLTEDLNDEKD